MQLALQDLRAEVGDEVVLIADLCLDEYTDHGHCGIVAPDGSVDNDATLELYAAGRRRPGRRRGRRRRPERDDGRPGRGDPRAPSTAPATRTPRSSPTPPSTPRRCTGPFRDAVDVTIAGGGDRKGYQQDPRNGREALAEIRADIAEGADIVMVKPALAYLDVIAAAPGPRPTCPSRRTTCRGSTR